MKLPLLGAQLGQQDPLEDQIADLLHERLEVARVDRLEHLVGLLEHERPQRLERLLAVPRAAVRRAQAGDDLDEAIEGGAGGVGHDPYANISTRARPAPRA